MDIGNDNDKLVCSMLGQRGARGLQKPRGGVPNTVRGQDGRGVPWEEEEMRFDLNFEDEMIRQLSYGKAEETACAK